MESIARKRMWLSMAAGAAAVALLAAGWVAASERARFVAGGAMVNVGYELQDPIEDFEVVDHEGMQPEAIWAELVAQNQLASGVRKHFPRSSRHPVIAMVVCMDARVDTVELTGDTRKYYYMVRTAGSVIGPEEVEMLELAVANGVKVVVLTTHSDCAAEKVAADPEKRRLYPALSAGIDERDLRIAAFLKRPAIAAKLASGDLVVKQMNIETATDAFVKPDH